MRLRLVLLGLSFRHLIFDLDGTLVDSASDLAAAANHTLARLGLEPLPPAAIVGFVGNGVRRLVEQAVLAAGGSDDSALVDEALAIFLRRYGAHLLDTTVLYPGIADLIPRLRAAGATLSIATNKPHAMAVAVVAGLGLGAYFSAVLGGDSLATRKPDPEIVHALVARSGMPRAQALLVGDSLVDVATARAAEIAVCTVTWGLTPPPILSAARPDFAVSRPDQLLGLLG